MVHAIYRKCIKPVIGKHIRQYIQKSYLATCYISYRVAGSFTEYIKGKWIYLFQLFLKEKDNTNLYAFMGKYGFCHLPYPFTLQYCAKHVIVSFDKE